MFMRVFARDIKVFTRRAARQKKGDMETKEFTSRRVFMMSLPIFLELLLQLLVGNADQAMLSSYSQNSVGAVGNANQIIDIAILVLNMLCTGATVLASQSLGAGDKPRVSVVSSVSALLVLLFGLLLSAVLLLFPEPLFRLISVPDTLIAEAAEYDAPRHPLPCGAGRIHVVCAILRSYGLVKEVLLTAVMMNTLNIGLNALLINGFCGFPRLGAAGAAISTDVSKVVGFALALVFLYKRTDARFLPRLLAKPFPVRELRSTLAISLPCGSETFSYQLSQLTIMKFVNRLGTAAINTKIYCYMMANAMYLYSVAIAQATQIVVGYLVGRNELGSVRARVWRSVLASIAVSESLNLLIYVFAAPIFGIFTQDPAIIALARQIILVEFALEARAVR